jgi:hypothetical protein
MIAVGAAAHEAGITIQRASYEADGSALLLWATVVATDGQHYHVELERDDTIAEELRQAALFAQFRTQMRRR